MRKSIGLNDARLKEKWEESASEKDRKKKRDKSKLDRKCGQKDVYIGHSITVSGV